MKRVVIPALLTVLFFACKKEPVKPEPVKPKVVKKELKGERPVIKQVKIPRILKIDQKLTIVLIGYFEKPGYKVTKHIIKRVGNEIGVHLFGKPKSGANSRFRYKIVLPPQKVGEYDIVAYGKKKHVNDILWVEEYKGEDRIKYLQRLKRKKAQQAKTDNNPDF